MNQFLMLGYMTDACILLIGSVSLKNINSYSFPLWFFASVFETKVNIPNRCSTESFQVKSNVEILLSFIQSLTYQ